MSPPQAEHLL